MSSVFVLPIASVAFKPDRSEERKHELKPRGGERSAVQPLPRLRSDTQRGEGAQRRGGEGSGGAGGSAGREDENDKLLANVKGVLLRVRNSKHSVMQSNAALSTALSGC